MHIKEVEYYEAITDGLKFEFEALTYDFYDHCENIIFGSEFTDLRFFCFHFYYDNYCKGVFEVFTKRIENLFKNIDQKEFPELHNGFANLLIYLREPSAKLDDQEYKNANINYWRDMVKDDLILSSHPSFKKYAKI